MRARVTLAITCTLVTLLGCDRSPPVAPLEAAKGGTGPTLSAPSNAVASPFSMSRVDVFWQDNSANESAFEVWRSLDGPAGTFAKVAGTSANVAGYSDEGLTPQTQYCYRVRAARTYDGKTAFSAFSNTACATTPAPPAPPAAPFGTSAKPQNSTTIDLMWSATYSWPRDGFHVERSLDGGATWTLAGSMGAYTQSFSDPGRTAEQETCYRVFAFNAGGDSPPSNTACTTPPAGPGELTAVGVDGPVIDLSWTDLSSVETGYAIERSNDGVSFSPLVDLRANTTTYHDGALVANATYWYRVRAKRDGGFSSFSNVASGMSGTLLPPATPTLFQPEGYYLGTIWLVWAANSTNAASFEIERCQGPTCTDFVLVATTQSTQSYMEAYMDSGTEGSVYSYRIRARNSAGTSPYSNVQTGRSCIEGVDPESPCFP